MNMPTWPTLAPHQVRKLQYLADEYRFRLKNHPRAAYLLESIRSIARRRGVDL